MLPEQIEDLMTRMSLPWSRIVKNMWAVEDPEGKYPRLVISVEKSVKKDSELLKFVVFICDVPADSPAEFFVEFMRHNFRVDHGTFAMESKSEMSFIDTLELRHTEPDEFEATLHAMRDAPRLFQEKYDIDVYTLGKPQF